MLLISHRGNLSGPNPEHENDPLYIARAISKGFKVEIDIWYKDNEYWLGHDKPQYNVSYDWLADNYSHLFIHCKNLDALVRFNYPPYKLNFNYFWHENDKAVLTSHSYIWAYPGNQPIKKSIAVMPEIYNDDLSECAGICSDYIINYL